MKLNKDYRYFKEWFNSMEKLFAHGQYTDEEIAYSAFLKGIKSQKKETGQAICSFCPKCQSIELVWWFNQNKHTCQKCNHEW